MLMLKAGPIAVFAARLLGAATGPGNGVGNSLGNSLGNDHDCEVAT